MEKGYISDKYNNPSFSLQFENENEINQLNIDKHDKKIRVFNEDFCRDNLKFIHNPNESIDSFAILGDLNNDIEEQIKNLKDEIGSDEEEDRNGLYQDLKIKSNSYNLAKRNYAIHNSQLNTKLDNKATSRDIGIKYKADKFGDQNYNRPKLNRDIADVRSRNYIKISDHETTVLETLLVETVNPNIPQITTHNFSFASIAESSKELIEATVGQSDKIHELVQNAILNKWVKEGKLLHENSNSICAFCNSEITYDRWKQLENHYDEESEKLEDNLEKLLAKIDVEIHYNNSFILTSANQFYSKFHTKFNKFLIIYDTLISRYITGLQAIKQQLTNRKNNLLVSQTFNEPYDYTNRLIFLFTAFNNICTQSNSYTSILNREKIIARQKLRLKEVSDFIETIGYVQEVTQVDNLLKIANDARLEKDNINNIIINKKRQISILENQLKDESKGADKVNEYLNNFFGHGSLKLKAMEIAGNDEEKKFKFEVIRNNLKAYHLSEGEASLISFCYFMAKLDDIDTKNEKSIIWIDDPISSLDSNHIFFIYSLIKAEIVEKHRFQQLFISTHNLDFLKYLKRLSGKDINDRDYTKLYLIIQRTDNTSAISIMPKYLKDFVTEFNYLFHQVYNCSKISTIDDSNYTMFYNFGNNARKFLEIYLYYKYPDGKEENFNKLQNFFAQEQIPTILTDRINNEYSHLAGVFERGSTPTEVPEMKLAADAIIRRIKETDEPQYKSFLLSIGEETN